MNKILVPYDFSELALHALNFAADLSRKAGNCSVTLINVIEHPTPETFKTMGVVGYDPMDAVFIKKMIEMTKGKMMDIMAEERYKDLSLNYKIVLGHPFKEITNEIVTEGVELVVMGTNGADGAQEFLIGSNAERMVRFSKCPVITINDTVNVDDIQDIVFASNFTDLSDSFVEHVKRIQKVFDAELRIVKVSTPSIFTNTRDDKKAMQEFVAKYDIKNYTLDVYNSSDEEDGIIGFSEDIDADMIAIGTKQRKGVGHFIKGSIAEDVVNHSPLPVWTFGLDVD